MATEIKAEEKEVRILLAHRHTLVREGMAGLLAVAGFDIVADTDHEEALTALVSRYYPDILLLEWDLPAVPADTVRQLVMDETFQGAVVLVGHPQPTEAVVDAIQAGARGCLSLNLPGEEFVSRVRLVAQGDFVVSQDMALDLGQRIEAKGADDANDGLSGREREVLALVSAGATNKEIAEELTITENTVKVHLRHILDKLDLRNRQAAAAYAVREGITEDRSNAEAEESYP
jgi:two-component system nitrate/nitrite response regulator NarL